MSGHDDTHDQADSAAEPDGSLVRERSHAVARVIEQVRTARAAGNAVSDRIITFTHSALLPELNHELDKLRRIDAAWIAASAPSSAGSELDSPSTVGPAEIELAAALAADWELAAVDVPGYSIIREIGRGGQAVVFLATKLNPGRRVALKVMRGGSLADETALARFRLETEILTELNHPNIVNIFETGLTADGSHYLAMNYVEGCGFDQYIRHHWETGQDLTTLLRLFVRICDVVNAAHLKHIVHRDLKPGNIRIDEHGEPHILDFGLAGPSMEYVAGERTIDISDSFFGSLPWSSPEQAQGDTAKIDVRSDVYSLGVILYQTLTGGLFPYDVVGSVQDVAHNIITNAPMPPSQAIAVDSENSPRKAPTGSAGVSKTMEMIVLKALAKQPQDRYENAGELARAVGNYLLDPKTTAPSEVTESPRQSTKGMSRRISVITAIAILIGTISLETLPSRGNRMKPSHLIKCLVLLVTANTFAVPKPAEHPAAAPHKSPLAGHLARAEANVRALDHHLAIAAERRVQAADARLAERARLLARHRLHEPLVWSEYVRRLPGGFVVDDNYHADVIVVDAEKAAAALGDNLDALWAKRKQVQAERMALWAKLAFRSVAEMDLPNQPLYRFELKAAGKPLDDQRMEALKAVVQFVRVVDHLANQAEEAVETDPRAVYGQWHKLVGAARMQMQDKMLLQSLVAMEVYKADTDAGKLAADAKQLSDLAQTITDSDRALTGAEFAGDDQEADASRAALQQALADTAAAVEAVNNSISKAAADWNIAVVPGTKVAVIDLPDLAGSGAGPAVMTPDAPDGTVYLTTLKEIRASTFENADWGFGKYGKLTDKNKATPIRVNGVPSPHGLGLHPPRKGRSVVEYALGREFGKFDGAVGLDDSGRALKSPIVFIVTGDGREFWHSKPVVGPQSMERFSINVSGVDRMEIIVECPGEHDGAHAVWFEPALLGLRMKTTVPAPVVAAPAPAAPPPAAPAPAPASGPAPGALVRTEMLGNSHSEAFQDDAPPGAILVGFDFTTGKPHGKKAALIIDSARPIYRGAAGDVPGRQLGKPNGDVTRVVARPGYGVVSIEIKTGEKHIQGMTLHFMRIDGNAAVPADAYDETYGPHPGPGQKVGDNRPIVGVIGEAGSNVDKLGLIMRN